MNLISERAEGSVPLRLVSSDSLPAWLEREPEATARWARACAFQAAPGATCIVPDETGAIREVLAGHGDSHWVFASLPSGLPPGSYFVAEDAPREDAERLALGWALGSYRYERFRAKRDQAAPTLVWPEGIDRVQTEAIARATFLVRDLINAPASDMGPADLAASARELAEAHGAELRLVVGERLLEEAYPAIHAVGRAAAPERAPRLIDLRWGDPSHPKVTLVGKGVCFDTGGLDLKSAGNMKLMKKDMGGAAHVLGVASLVMATELPVRLRVLIPAVENSVSGNALRPLDVVPTRKGTTIEIGNTDAEGRVILADALTDAASEGPDLLVDFATLTGAARVALGTELPALFSNHDKTANALLAHGTAVHDPLWRMPLWKPYRRFIDGKIGDITNSADSRFGGAITAALFLQEFVDDELPWVHIDVMAWNPSSRPGRPEGGEAMGMRAVYALIADRF